MFKPLLPALVLGALTTAASAQSTPVPVTPAQSTPASASDAVILRLNLTQGQSYKMRMKMQQKTSQTIQGQRMDVTTDMTIDMSMTVKDVSTDGIMAVDTQYTSMLMKISGEMGGQKFSSTYDSSRPQQASPTELKMLSAMLNQSLIMQMTPTGQVKEIQGLDKMWKNMIAKVPPPKGVTRATHEKNMKSLRDQFGEQNFRNMSNSMAIFPVNAVSIGDSWSHKSTMNAGFPISMQYKYTLKRVENGVANIVVNTILQMTSGASGIAGDKVKFNMSGAQIGTLTVDKATGWTNMADFSYRFSGRISMPYPNRPAKTMSWPIYMKGVVKLETIPQPHNHITPT